MNKEELEKEVITEYVMLYCQATNRLTEEIIKNQELQDRIDKAIEDIEFCLVSIKQEEKMSTDKRTNKEMITCRRILEELLDILKGGNNE